MDLKSEGSFVDDNDSISRVSASEGVGTAVESRNNGSCILEEDLGNKELIAGSSETPPMTRKGFGLKKWKRIKRVVNKSGGGSSQGSAKIDFLSPEVNSSKRLQFSADANQKSQGSVSSTNAVERGTLLGDSGLAMEPLFATGTDSENSEDRSSKSSTASAPKIINESHGIMGFSTNKGSFWGSSGKNIADTVQAKGRVETSKKARGDLVQVEKENSNSRSLFIHSNNEVQIERPSTDYGPYGDVMQGISRLLNDDIRDGSCRNYEGIFADTSWKDKNEGSENLVFSINQDPHVESIFALQSVQEALEKELIKFREILKDDSAEYEFEDGSQKLDESISPQSLEVLESEVEDLFSKKIEAEFEYLAMSRTVQQLRIESSKNKLQDAADNNDKVFPMNNKKKIESDACTSYSRMVCKYTSCVILQLVLLTVIIGVTLCRLSANHIEVVPT